MDLALNNLQRVLCHKTQTTNQPTQGLLGESPWHWDVVLSFWLGTISLATVIKYNTMVWPGTNYNTIALVRHQMCYYVLRSVTIWTLLFGYVTKCNNILEWHHCNTMVLYGLSDVILWFGAWPHCNNISVTTINSDTSAKCNTVGTTTFAVPNLIIIIIIIINVIIIIILVTAPNAVL